MMTTSQHLSINIVLVSLIALVFANISTIKCDPDTTIDDFFCSDEKYEPYSDYAAEIEFGLETLTYQTCLQTPKQLSISGRYATGLAYAQTYVTDVNDCARCLEAANDFLEEEDCYLSVNAFVAMVDCGMRYFPN